jgi:hypothetical protein
MNKKKIHAFIAPYLPLSQEQGRSGVYRLQRAILFTTLTLSVTTLIFGVIHKYVTG